MSPDKHFVTSVLRRKPYLAATAVLTAAAAAMTQLPLVDDLGFEFAFLTAAVATFATGVMTVHLVNGWRGEGLRGAGRPGNGPRTDGPLTDGPRNTRHSTLLALLFGLSLSTLLLPMAVMFVKSWISGFCNVPEGLAFYLLLPGISVLWATAVALLCALATERRRHGTLLFLGVMFVSIGISLYQPGDRAACFRLQPDHRVFPRTDLR